MSKRAPKQQRPGAAWDDVSAGLRLVFFIAGSLLNLLALIALFVNIVGLVRLWLSGSVVTLGSEHLMPLGIFLAGALCYLIAYYLD